MSYYHDKIINVVFFLRLTDESEFDSQNEYSCLVAPKAPMGISGTALAASLLRDGLTVGSFIICFGDGLHLFLNLKSYYILL